jgi:hypothetical protein
MASKKPEPSCHAPIIGAWAVGISWLGVTVLAFELTTR